MISEGRLYSFWVAGIIGLLIVIIHIGTSIYLWFSFVNHSLFKDEIAAHEITLPLTVAYVVSVIKWFIDTKGIRKSDETYGWLLVLLIVIVVGCFLIALPLGPYLYLSGEIKTADGLNKYYIGVEAVLGVMFALLFGEMFGTALKESRRS